jgi:hypothetical protein
LAKFQPRVEAAAATTLGYIFEFVINPDSIPLPGWGKPSSRSGQISHVFSSIAFLEG